MTKHPEVEPTRQPTLFQMGAAEPARLGRVASHLELGMMSMTEPQPCEKFRSMTITPEFVEHVNVEKCPKCLAGAPLIGKEFEEGAGMAEVLLPCGFAGE